MTTVDYWLNAARLNYGTTGEAIIRKLLNEDRLLQLEDLYAIGPLPFIAHQIMDSLIALHLFEARIAWIDACNHIKLVDPEVCDENGTMIDITTGESIPVVQLFLVYRRLRR